MAGKTFLYDYQVLDAFFFGTAIPYIATNTHWYVSLHTADPDSESLNPSCLQTYVEVAYGDYARQAVARTAGGWTRTGNVVHPVAAIQFPKAISGLVTATHFGIGSAASGPGQLFYSGPLAYPILIATEGQPVLSTATIIGEG